MKLFEAIKKQINRETILYVIFGVLTTIVNYAVFVPLTAFCGMSNELANLIAWIAAVVFAYIVNKFFVFQSKVKSPLGIAREFFLFTSGRIFSFLIEEAGIVFVTYLGFNHLEVYIAKAFLAIITIVLNYIFGKLIIFKKRKEAIK